MDSLAAGRMFSDDYVSHVLCRRTTPPRADGGFANRGRNEGDGGRSASQSRLGGHNDRVQRIFSIVGQLDLLRLFLPRNSQTAGMGYVGIDDVKNKWTEAGSNERRSDERFQAQDVALLLSPDLWWVLCDEFV